jgi:hypothetical protein
MVTGLNTTILLDFEHMPISEGPVGKPGASVLIVSGRIWKFWGLRLVRTGSWKSEQDKRVM